MEFLRSDIAQDNSNIKHMQNLYKKSVTNVLVTSSSGEYHEQKPENCTSCNLNFMISFLIRNETTSQRQESKYFLSVKN